MSEPTVAVARSADEAATILRRRYRKHIAKIKAWVFAHWWDGRTLLDPSPRVLWVESPYEPGKVLQILLSFDYGAHNCGWWRNSQYDRCWHLSVTVRKAIASLVGPDGRSLGRFESPDERDVRAVADAYFGAETRKAWIETPASVFDPYRNVEASAHCYHVRLFTDRTGKRIVKPEGEVYTLVPWAEGDSPEKVYR